MFKKLSLLFVLATGFNTTMTSEWIKIAGAWTAAAIGYAGLVHNQVTIRVAPEYFRFIPQLVGLSENTPHTVTALTAALYINIIPATLAGILIATAARAGTNKKLSFKDTKKYLLTGLGVTALAGIAGFTISLLYNPSLSYACVIADNCARIAGCSATVMAAILIILERMK